MIGTAVSRVASLSPPLLPHRTTSALAAAAASRTPWPLGLRAGRRSSSYQPPTPPKQEKSSTYANAQRAFYRDFGAPVAKVFLGALVTYQVLYWGWLKLETLETKEEKTAEMASLEAQVRKAAGAKKDGK
ncbi:pantetheine-phosphate adenylyltransferase family protein [Diplodia corticola]|uniref:Pantetheine-phosphate adenylyltransferase family protein n=1 Tax=Diplodia corticola TaxID=236234 RepID=A0A1J9RRT2_9PEZI|nr:pantetheine-phosphate adenylyltransferase family protein [Diplodia corticola]OJD31143.1 pantetheine-phosphate adenylyltransferase family protein [Diplodia corticola]